MNNLITRSVVVAAVMGCSACTTVTRGSNESYGIHTNPPGAIVTSSSGFTCKTPCSVKVKRRSDFVLTIEREGYETVTASVTSSIDGAGGAGMAGNVLLGGFVGAAVDAGTGAMHSHKPNPLVVNLARLEDVATAADSEQKPATLEGAQRIAESMECKQSIELESRGSESETWVLQCGDGESLNVRCFGADCYITDN